MLAATELVTRSGTAFKLTRVLKGLVFDLGRLVSSARRTSWYGQRSTLMDRLNVLSWLYFWPFKWTNGSESNIPKLQKHGCSFENDWIRYRAFGYYIGGVPTLRLGIGQQDPPTYKFVSSTWETWTVVWYPTKLLHCNSFCWQKIPTSNGWMRKIVVFFGDGWMCPDIISYGRPGGSEKYREIYGLGLGLVDRNLDPTRFWTLYTFYIWKW